MKNLIYKELKLSMHPICYIFILIFPFMILIPSYPIGVGFIYVLTCYPILFLGANKGQQSNDLIYSTLLPVRKKDIVLARIITLLLMQFTFILIMSCLLPIAKIISQEIINGTPIGEPIPEIPGLGLNSFISVVAIAIIGFSIADIIYLPIYYKHGKSIVLSSLISIFAFVIYIMFFTLIITYIPGFEWLVNIFQSENNLIQIVVLLIAIIIYIIMHFITYKISSNELEKVDF